ncbi:MAG TPA: nicotinate-nucleotide adenylyltransferase [Vicinamibacteria bacterium]|nr:nicotinate-nucleotide adenylyltransferase [Vicinamibacteria bacterium]
MRAGLLGGTFDPIHLGHLRAAENAREALALDRVAFVPAAQPPHRPPPVSSARDRFAMVALATAGHSAFYPSDAELEREGPSYTVDTLRAWRALRPQDELVLVVGSDAFLEMGTWREAEALFTLCTVAVVARPGEALPPGPGPSVAVSGPGLQVSSSEVRRLLAAGQSVRYLVPEAVADYIEKRGLYR